MTAVERALRILVVDEDPGVQKLLVLLFQREGWRVTTARDGDTALSLLQTELPDVLVLDLMLPKTSGFGVLEWIGSTRPAWLRHVIVVTAASKATLRALTREREICRLVRKPFDIGDLVGAVHSCAASHGLDGPRSLGHAG